MMKSNVMNLKILLPFRIFNEITDVKSIIVETSEGMYGFLPQRLDCVVALVPGIFMYETDQIHYVATDEGVMVKAGAEVLVSVNNAIEGSDLQTLKETVQKEFLMLDDEEKSIRSMMAKMESEFVKNIEKFQK